MCSVLTTKQLIMSTENTSLNTVAPARDSNVTNTKVIGKSNIYQCQFLIIAGFEKHHLSTSILDYCKLLTLTCIASMDYS